jgi:tetratricopeptide (TPR) repeat protein
MSTLGLAMITNKPSQARDTIAKYEKYFDKVYLTIAADSETNREAREIFKDNTKVEKSYFRWIDHFGKARIFNHKQIKTDYFFWIDDDDEIVNPERLSDLVRFVEDQEIDCLFLNYDYYQNEVGEQQANHWRERLIKTSLPSDWSDIPCHETFTPVGHSERSDAVSVKHHKSVNQMMDSMARNKILLEKDWKTNKDPRTAYYLGMTYEYNKQFKEAIDMYLFLIEKGGWDEQKVISWNHIADCFYFTEKLEDALKATDQAIHLDPSHPDAYYQKVLIYSAGSQLDKAVEWAEVAMTKKPNEDTMQLIDPTRYTYKGTFLAAQSNLFLGRVDRAFELYQQVIKLAPYFLQQVNLETKQDWNKVFEEAYYDKKAIDYTKYLTHYLKERNGKPRQLFEALPPQLANDIRLNAERVIAIPPKKWPKKSIAMFCGQGFEPWGPDVLDKGMGGSEEAVIYLTRELAQLGWDVTVFCERDAEYIDGVPKPYNWHGDHDPVITYKPWTEFNPWDTFDVLISWRQPMNARGIKARKKIVDLHDTVDPKHLEAVVDEVDLFLVKSDYHRKLYPNIPDDKIKVITNGIYKDLEYAI